MTTGAWWEAHPAVELTVDCSDEQHQVRWESGMLHIPSHADPGGERALKALGGEPCACVDLLDKWERHTSDLRVLTLASRGAGDVIQPPYAHMRGTVSTSSGGWTGFAPMAIGQGLPRGGIARRLPRAAASTGIR
ncbi:MAG: hypothetical protein ACRD6W_08835, partial [Nitrososphaerales archaeon]